MAARAIPPRSIYLTFVYWAAASAISAFVLLRPIPVAVSHDFVGVQLLRPELSRELSSWSMPGASLLAALTQDGGRAVVSLQLPVLLCALLAFSLGCELESLLAGLVAAVLAIGVMIKRSPLDLEQLLLSDGVLLVSALLAAPSKRPRWKDVAVGGAIAASLLVRGVLAPLPALVALSGAFFRQGARRVLLRAALLSLFPLLVILAWGLVLRSANGRFVFLEWSGTRADSNLITMKAALKSRCSRPSSASSRGVTPTRGRPWPAPGLSGSRKSARSRLLLDRMKSGSRRFCATTTRC